MENRYANKFYMVTPSAGCSAKACTELVEVTAAGAEDGSISV
jgi:hypothetical protein